jgi:putative FmdB family regulatory protein
MPTYEYACRACGEKFELFQPITSKTVQPCPKCGKSAQRRISGGAGLIFKGSGFYITDYRSKDYQSQASADKPAGAPPAGGKKDAGTPAGGGDGKKDAAKPAPTPSPKTEKAGNSGKKH